MLNAAFAAAILSPKGDKYAQFAKGNKRMSIKNAMKETGRFLLVLAEITAAFFATMPIAAMTLQDAEEPRQAIVTDYHGDYQHVSAASAGETSAESQKNVVSEEDVTYLATAIYCEAGSDSISDLTRYYVADVILNRVESADFPDTIHGVLTQEYAYGTFAWTGIVFPEYSASEWEQPAVDRAYDVARDVLLNGNHTWLYGNGYVWQSEYRQSEDSFYLDGFWFGK